MDDSDIFCPHCGEFVAERTFRRHKNDYLNKERGSWDVRVHYPSSDEESSAKENDCCETYDKAPEFGCFEDDAEEDEYMEVYLESARVTIEFWEDAVEEVLTDFDEAGPSASSTSIDAEVSAEEKYAKQLCIVKWICLFLLFSTAQFQISDNALDLLLGFFNTVYHLPTIFSLDWRYCHVHAHLSLFSPQETRARQ